MAEYLGILIFFVLAAVFAGVFLALASWLGPQKPSLIKSEPFECGQMPLTQPSGRFHIQFYLIAILFILFDVELIFLFPWAVAYSKLGVTGLVEMAVFLGILMSGFYYALDNGALDWD